MLHRIIRVIFFSIPLGGFILLATRVGAPSAQLNYYSMIKETQNSFADTLSLDPKLLPKGSQDWVLRNPKAVFRVLSMRLNHLNPSAWKEEQVQELSLHIWRLSCRYNFPPELILSLIEVESSFIPTAVSDKGAVGLMQVMPDTAAELAAELSIPWDGEKSLRDPWKNLELGFQYMEELRKKFKSQRQYLTAYNMGPTALVRKLRNRQPYSESYYNKIMRSYRMYSAEEISEAL